MKRIYYLLIILFLNLTTNTFVFANGGVYKRELARRTDELFAFITREVEPKYNFKDANHNESLKGKIIAYLESTMKIVDYNEQYRLLRTARRSTDKFEKNHTFVYEHSDDIASILGMLSNDIRTKHPNDIKPDKTVMFSQLNSFISNCDLDDDIIINHKSIDGACGCSGIEDEIAKVKGGMESYEQLKVENNFLKTQYEISQKTVEELRNKQLTLVGENERLKTLLSIMEQQKTENQKLIDKQLVLGTENESLKAEIGIIKKQRTDDLANLDKTNTLNRLYRQITVLYQKLIKSKDDFDAIIRLRKQIEREEYNEKK